MTSLLCLVSVTHYSPFVLGQTSPYPHSFILPVSGAEVQKYFPLLLLPSPCVFSFPLFFPFDFEASGTSSFHYTLGFFHYTSI